MMIQTPSGGDGRVFANSIFFRKFSGATEQPKEQFWGLSGGGYGPGYMGLAATTCPHGPFLLHRSNVLMRLTRPRTPRQPWHPLARARSRTPRPSHTIPPPAVDAASVGAVPQAETAEKDWLERRAELVEQHKEEQRARRAREREQLQEVPVAWGRLQRGVGMAVKCVERGSLPTKLCVVCGANIDYLRNYVFPGTRPCLPQKKNAKSINFQPHALRKDDVRRTNRTNEIPFPSGGCCRKTFLRKWNSNHPTQRLVSAKD